MRSRALVVGLAVVLVALVACGGTVKPESEGAGGHGGAAGNGGAGTARDSGTNSGGASAGGACTQEACDTFGMIVCCSNACTNLVNDPRNCGKCGVVCPSEAPLCSGGTCMVPSCGDPSSGAPPPTCADPSSCCGAYCCGPNEICCTVHRGGASFGLELGCFDPRQSDGTCPRGCPHCVCASPDTPVATPEGERAIASLVVGDRVLSVDRGRVTEVPVVEVHRAAAANHHVVRLELANGSVLEISAPHPTADGRTFGDLRAGDSLGGVSIRSVTVIPYEHSFTYDIRPGSDSGTYFAGGVLIGSTLGGDALSSGGTDYSMVVLPSSLP